MRLAELVGAPSHVTTHVLDAASGRPAAGVGVVLEALRAEAGGGHAGRGSGCWHGVATATTDDDGRVRDLGPAALHPGTYRVRFATGDWFAARDVDTFYPEVVVVFRVGAPDEPGAGHYHVPLLLSPFAYSTYRGS
ncbi:hydroxyisourate hydrolase [Luteimicrobium subarcticum]|uniref:hydroxyisourate hydrolase n=1 Tax=Luteimicrobium subarcticum TaxID=620910 RepID=UPI001FEB348C|nr:hydroxyisourate hydrolase [Luteimicrobium subarcticum]